MCFRAERVVFVSTMVELHRMSATSATAAAAAAAAASTRVAPPSRLDERAHRQATGLGRADELAERRTNRRTNRSLVCPSGIAMDDQLTHRAALSVASSACASALGFLCATLAARFGQQRWPLKPAGARLWALCAIVHLHSVRQAATAAATAVAEKQRQRTAAKFAQTVRWHHHN